MPVVTRSQTKNNTNDAHFVTCIQTRSQTNKEKVISAETDDYLIDWFKKYCQKTLDQINKTENFKEEKWRLIYELFFIIDYYIYGVLVATKNSKKYEEWVIFSATFYNKAIQFEAELSNMFVNSADYKNVQNKNIVATIKRCRKSLFKALKTLDLQVFFGDIFLYEEYYQIITDIKYEDKYLEI